MWWNVGLINFINLAGNWFLPDCCNSRPRSIIPTAHVFIVNADTSDCLVNDSAKFDGVSVA